MVFTKSYIGLILPIKIRERGSTVEKTIDKALMVATFEKRTDSDYIADYMIEFAELAKACDLYPEHSILQMRDKIEVTTYIGKGKVEEVKIFADDNDIDVVVFNVELSGVQLRNLEDALGRKVIDRTMLILDIFARRAKSSIAKMQVELAQQKYLLPRLIGVNENLSKTGGASSGSKAIGTRGPGEQKLELDRRKINDKIADLAKRLKQAEEKVALTKRSRIKNNVKTVALVGYTNAGKSSLLNLFVDRFGAKNDDAKVFAKDMLFATLDTYSRKLEIDNKTIIMTDTVGFVSDLPHGLVKAFSSTLEEVKDSDLVFNVIDVSDKNHKMHKRVTLETLKSLGVDESKVISLYNKIDLTKPDFVSEKNYISAIDGHGVENVVKVMTENLFGKDVTAKFLIPYESSKYYDAIIKKATILETEYAETGSLVEAVMTPDVYQEFKQFEVE